MSKIVTFTYGRYIFLYIERSMDILNSEDYMRKPKWKKY